MQRKLNHAVIRHPVGREQGSLKQSINVESPFYSFRFFPFRSFQMM